MIRAGSTRDTGVDRSTIARSDPLVSIPNVPPYVVPNRLPQKASATSGGAKRTSSEPCRQAAIRPASTRAPGLERPGVAEQRERVVDGAVQPAVRAARSADLGDPRLQHLRLAAEGAQHVEGVDVARALPDRVERRLAEHQRQARLLDVAVAAEALQRLGHHRGRALADPELRERERDPAQGHLVGVARPVDGRGQPHREGGGGLRLDREVGDDVLHQRLVDEQPAERRAVGDVPGRLGQRVAHQRRRAEDAVEPRRGDHLDDRAHPATLVAQPLGEGAVELELAGGVGPVAELVLEPHHVDPVAGAVRPARAAPRSRSSRPRPGPARGRGRSSGRR